MELADKDLSTNYQSHCDPRVSFRVDSFSISLFHIVSLSLSPSLSFSSSHLPLTLLSFPPSLILPLNPTAQPRTRPRRRLPDLGQPQSGSEGERLGGAASGWTERKAGSEDRCCFVDGCCCR